MMIKIEDQPSEGIVPLRSCSSSYKTDWRKSSKHGIYEDRVWRPNGKNQSSPKRIPTLFMGMDKAKIQHLE